MKPEKSYQVVNVNDRLYLTENPHSRKFNVDLVIAKDNQKFLIAYHNLGKWKHWMRVNQNNHWRVSKLYSYLDNPDFHDGAIIKYIDPMTDITMTLDEYINVCKLTPIINHSYQPTRNNIKKIYQFMDHYYYGENKSNPQASDTIYDRHNEPLAEFDTGDLIKNRSLASQYLFYRIGESNLYPESKLVDIENSRKYKNKK